MRKLTALIVLTAFFLTINSNKSAAGKADFSYLQSNYSSGGYAIFPDQWIGTTANVGVTGRLTEVDLPLWQFYPDSSDLLTLVITTLAGSSPGQIPNTVLAATSITISASVIPVFPPQGSPPSVAGAGPNNLGGLAASNARAAVIPVEFDLPGAGLAVTAGERIGIALERSANFTDTNGTWLEWDLNTAHIPAGNNDFLSNNMGATWMQLPGSNPSLDPQLGFQTVVNAVPEPPTITVVGVLTVVSLFPRWRRGAPATAAAA